MIDPPDDDQVLQPSSNEQLAVMKETKVTGS